MSKGGDWINVADAGLKCPICGKPDWCLLHIDGKKVLCPRVRSVTVMGKAGYLHKVYDNGLNMETKPRKRRSNLCVNWESLAKQYCRKARKNLSNLEGLSAVLGVEVDRLQRTWRLGWDGEACTIPAYDGHGDMVGIMRRFPDGHKVWVSRSKNGLFMPKMKSWEGNLFVCEGWSDAAALVAMGFRAIGRSNCQTGIDYVKQLLRRYPTIAQVSVVGDNDKDNVHGNVGQTGAQKFAASIKPMTWAALTSVPEQYKDMREWFLAGATKQGVVERTKRI